MHRTRICAVIVVVGLASVEAAAQGNASRAAPDPGASVPSVPQRSAPVRQNPNASQPAGGGGSAPVLPPAVQAIPAIPGIPPVALDCEISSVPPLGYQIRAVNRSAITIAAGSEIEYSLMWNMALPSHGKSVQKIGGIYKLAAPLQPSRAVVVENYISLSKGTSLTWVSDCEILAHYVAPGPVRR